MYKQDKTNRSENQQQNKKSLKQPHFTNLKQIENNVVDIGLHKGNRKLSTSVKSDNVYFGQHSIKFNIQQYKLQILTEFSFNLTKKQKNHIFKNVLLPHQRLAFIAMIKMSERDRACYATHKKIAYMSGYSRQEMPRITNLFHNLNICIKKKIDYYTCLYIIDPYFYSNQFKRISEEVLQSDRKPRKKNPTPIHSSSSYSLFINKVEVGGVIESVLSARARIAARKKRNHMTEIQNKIINDLKLDMFDQKKLSNYPDIVLQISLDRTKKYAKDKNKLAGYFFRVLFEQKAKYDANPDSYEPKKISTQPPSKKEPLPEPEWLKDYVKTELTQESVEELKQERDQHIRGRWYLLRAIEIAKRDYANSSNKQELDLRYINSYQRSIDRRTKIIADLEQQITQFQEISHSPSDIPFIENRNPQMGMSEVLNEDTPLLPMEDNAKPIGEFIRNYMSLVEPAPIQVNPKFDNNSDSYDDPSVYEEVIDMDAMSQRLWDKYRI